MLKTFRGRLDTIRVQLQTGEGVYENQNLLTYSWQREGRFLNGRGSENSW